jgi:phosphate transport system permease protein
MTRGNPFRSHSSPATHKTSRWGDRIFLVLTGIGAAGVIGVLVAVGVVLYYGALPIINRDGLAFLTNRVWNPEFNVYGIVPFAAGTLITSAIALLISVPLSIGAALFLTQHAPQWLREPIAQVIQMLAAIPSVIFGFWGLIVIVPVMASTVNPALAQYLGWTGLFGGPTDIGTNVLTASVVLAIMTVPTITALSKDSIQAVPRTQTEAAISLGATDWEVSRNAVLPYARGGIVAGIVLGLGRALGETMAVTLVIGNANVIPNSFLGPGQTIASLIANDFFENFNPLERPALLYAALVLLVITLVVNVGARLLLARFQRGMGVKVE